jgi:hypothetical protein
MLSLRPAVLLLLFAAVAFAAPALADDYVRYLIPVTGKNVIGANGSIWTTEFTIHNPRDEEMTILVFSCTGIDIITPSCGNSVTLTPMVSRSIDVRAPGDGTDGAFLYVPKNLNYGPTPMTLRARDLSKDAQNFGTEIPIARLDDFAQGIILTEVSITNNETQQVTTITAHP